MNIADTTLLINKELTRIGIPLDHEHARYFRDGVLFAQKQALTLTSVVGQSEQLKAVEELVDFARDVTNVCDLDRLEEILDRL